MVHPRRKPLLSMILIVVGASVLIQVDAGSVSLPLRKLEMNCACGTPCGEPCGIPSLPPPSLPPPSLPVLEPPPLPPPAGPVILPPPLCPPPLICPPTPPSLMPYTPAVPNWFTPPVQLYPVDTWYHSGQEAGRSSAGWWSPVLASCWLLALWF